MCLASNCPLRVQEHLQCSRHSWTSQSFVWRFPNGATIDVACKETKLLESQLEVPMDKDDLTCGGLFLRDDCASINATVTVFRWVLSNGEGIPLEDAYHDPWIHIILRRIRY